MRYFNRIMLVLLLAGILISSAWGSLAFAKDSNSSGAERGIKAGIPGAQAQILTKSLVLPEILTDSVPDHEFLDIDRARSQSDYPYNSYDSGALFFPPYPSNNERLGFGKTSDHDTSALNAGWYLDWTAKQNPAHPGGAEFGQTIYFSVNGVSRCNAASVSSQVTPRITGTTLINYVKANPGMLWMVGNEPDSFYNGSPIHPHLYAELYHYFYTTIKRTDPTAKVAVGAIVQPSPLRMEYLDKILSHYQAIYGEALQTDLWNIHFYILNEGPCNASWGAAVPPDSSTNQGWNITFNAQSLLDLEQMEENLINFRQWLKDRGQNDKPLIITEYGVLPPPSYAGFSNAVAAQFLKDSANMFLTTTDPDVGYAADGNRLIQFWAWFSSDHAPPPGWFKYGGDLYETGTIDTLTIIGDAFVETAMANKTNYVDLQVVPSKTPVVIGADQVSLDLFVLNKGNYSSTEATMSVNVVDLVTRDIVYQEDITLAALGPRYQHDPLPIIRTWPLTAASIYTVTVEIVSEEDVNLANNFFGPKVSELSPDLTVSDLAVTPLTHFPELITGTVTNIGEVGSGPTTLLLSIMTKENSTLKADEVIGVPNLGPGQEMSFTWQWPVAEIGDFEVTAVVNPDAEPGTELDFSNNQMTQSVRLYPDLAVSDLQVTPLSILSDGQESTETVNINIRNTGNITALETTLDLAIYKIGTGAQNVQTSFPISELAVNETVPLTYSWHLSQTGLYQVVGEINPEQTSGSEVNFANNKVSHVVIVTDTASARSAYVVEPNTETVITNTDSLTTEIVLPGGAVSETVVLIYTPLISPSIPLPSTALFANRAFELDIYRDGVMVPDFQFNKPISITLAYTDTFVTESIVISGSVVLTGSVIFEDESDLKLYRRVGSRWQDARRGCAVQAEPQIDLERNRFMVALCQVGEFALIELELKPLYLPLLFK